MCRGTQCHDASDASPRQQPAIPRTGFDVLLCAPESRLLVMGIAHWSSAPYLCAMPAPTTASPCLFFEETPPAKPRLRSPACEAERGTRGMGEHQDRRWDAGNKRRRTYCNATGAIKPEFARPLQSVSSNTATQESTVLHSTGREDMADGKRTRNGVPCVYNWSDEI